MDAFLSLLWVTVTHSSASTSTLWLVAACVLLSSRYAALARMHLSIYDALLTGLRDNSGAHGSMALFELAA